MKSLKKKLTLFLLCMTIWIMPVHAANSISWNQWVQQLRQQAITEGISADLFDSLFATIQAPDQKTINLDRKQPEKRITYLQYRNTRGDAFRIKIGQRKYSKYTPLLEQLNRMYGVDPCIITAIWGMESSYGNYMGNFPVIKSLATLAYDDRRSEFFRKELLIALHILNEGHVSIANFKGEWAGGSGMPQFLPSSWQEYAVDYDGDGHKDIWTNVNDALASIANYLAQNGWQKNQPWGLEVTLSQPVNPKWIGYETVLPLSQWIAMGVKPLTPFQFPQGDLPASLLNPEGGPNLLVFHNFNVLRRYNNSTFYAGTISYVADKICHRR